MLASCFLSGRTMMGASDTVVSIAKPVLAEFGIAWKAGFKSDKPLFLLSIGLKHRGAAQQTVTVFL